MKAAIGLLAIAIALAGCTQKSDVDKCVEAWELMWDFIPDDEQAKKNQLLEIRKKCMRPGYTANKSLAMDLETIQTLCAKKAGPDKTIVRGNITYSPGPGLVESKKAECELEYRIKQQEANKPF